jgi:hypothetical protein
VRGSSGSVRQRVAMEVQRAAVEDVSTYTAMARVAQAWLRARGLGQYVPAAHDEYASAIRLRAESGTLYAARDGDTSVGFFSLDPAPSPWWPADDERAPIFPAWWSVSGLAATESVVTSSSGASPRPVAGGAASCASIVTPAMPGCARTMSPTRLHSSGTCGAASRLCRLLVPTRGIGPGDGSGA